MVTTQGNAGAAVLGTTHLPLPGPDSINRRPHTPRKPPAKFDWEATRPRNPDGSLYTPPPPPQPEPEAEAEAEPEAAVVDEAACDIPANEIQPDVTPAPVDLLAHLIGLRTRMAEELEDLDKVIAQHQATTAPPSTAAPATTAKPKRTKPTTAKPRKTPTPRGVPLNPTDIIARYQAGDSGPTIAAHYGTTPGRIRRLLDAHNIPRRDDRAANSGRRANPNADDPQLVAEATRLYLEEQLPLSEIGSRLGWSWNGIRKLLLRHGVPLRPPAHQANGRTRPGKLTADQIQQIRDRYTAGESTTALARAFDVSTPTICHHLDAAGIERRHRNTNHQ